MNVFSCLRLEQKCTICVSIPFDSQQFDVSQEATCYFMFFPPSFLTYVFNYPFTYLSLIIKSIPGPLLGGRISLMWVYFKELVQ